MRRYWLLVAVPPHKTAACYDWFDYFGADVAQHRERERGINDRDLVKTCISNSKYSLL